MQSIVTVEIACVIERITQIHITNQMEIIAKRKIIFLQIALSNNKTSKKKEKSCNKRKMRSKNDSTEDFA